jgi:phosphoribosylanthranilate isomerase
MIQVKVCGITRLEDALAAVAAGANLLGFIFAPSPRRIEPAAAARIRERLPDGVERVGVFVNERPERIREIARLADLTWVQLNGSEPVTMETELDLPVLRALRVSDPDVTLLEAQGRPTTHILLEPAVAGKAGGTGVSLDPGVAAALVAALPGKRVFLAGGLGPENVRGLVEAARPYGVDASSRLEVSPGIKDPVLVRQFLEVLRACSNE